MVKIKYFIPLVLFIVPTIIGSIVLWPPEAIQASLIGGFTVMLLSMIMTYVYGIQSVLKDIHQKNLDVKK
jgi:hypothetical protein